MPTKYNLPRGQSFCQPAQRVLSFSYMKRIEQRVPSTRTLLVITIIAILGVVLLQIIQAAGPKISVQPSATQVVGGGRLLTNDNTAANRDYVSFGSQGGNGCDISADHDLAVARIQAARNRNRTMDDSPFLCTPSAALPTATGSPLLESNLAVYANPNQLGGHFGNYGTPPFYQIAVIGDASLPNGATFRANCEVSHFSYDDPIVHPNQPEKAHLHMFFGNTHTNAYSTYDSILNSGSSTCNGKELNRTSYWVPAMMDGAGNAIIPFNSRFYYKTEMNTGPGRVVVYPENLQIVADQRSGGPTFRCNDIWNSPSAQTPHTFTIPNCSSTTASGFPGVLEYQIYFDYCWNGQEATIDDWRANRSMNLVPPRNHWWSSDCPPSHPFMFPALVTHIFYDIPAGSDTSRWHLSSDVDPDTLTIDGARGSSAHADWFGAWNKDINKEWVDNCSNVPGASCGEGHLESVASDPFRTNARALVIREDYDAGQIPTLRLEDIYNEMCSAASERPFSPANGGINAAYCRP